MVRLYFNVSPLRSNFDYILPMWETFIIMFQWLLSPRACFPSIIWRQYLLVSFHPLIGSGIFHLGWDRLPAAGSFNGFLFSTWIGISEMGPRSWFAASNTYLKHGHMAYRLRSLAKSAAKSMGKTSVSKCLRDHPEECNCHTLQKLLLQTGSLFPSTHKFRRLHWFSKTMWVFFISCITISDSDQILPRGSHKHK